MQTKDSLPGKHGGNPASRLLIPLLLMTVLLYAGSDARATTSPAGNAPATPKAGAGAMASAAAPSAAAVNDITGTADADEVTTASLCSPAPPGDVACDLQVLVSDRNHQLIHPRLARAYPYARTQARASFSSLTPLAVQADTVQADTEPAAAPLPQSGTPAFIQQAYDLTYLSETAGGGATVGIVDAYNDPTAASDLAAYRAYYGLPACTTVNGCLTVDSETSTTESEWEGETSLDLDAVSAVCPNCHIVLVEVPNTSLTALTDGIATAHALGATYLSNSWGENGSSIPDSGFSFSGATTFAASGDGGYTSSPQLPAALPDVTAVGGTTLTYAPQTARGYAESTWNGAAEGVGTGSGCDSAEGKPAWQTNDGTGCTGRSYNDLSADGDPDTGLQVYSTSWGGWGVVGGTSLATPLTAAYYALIGNAGASPAWPYQRASLLNDVTSGDNIVGATCPSDPGICSAGVGFDGPTGNGTISGDVVNGAPGVGSNGYSAGAAGSSATVTVGVYPNGAATLVHLEYGPPGGGYTAQTAAQSIGAGSQAVQATFTLTGVASGYHYRVVATNPAGTTYGYDVPLADATGWPSVTSASVTATSATTAQATLVVSYNGSGSVQIVYGPTTAYGLTSSSQSGSGTADSSITFSGLTPGTTYHWAAVITNGAETFTTPDATFTTTAASSTASSGSNGSAGSGSGSSGYPTPAQGSEGTTAAGPSSRGLRVQYVRGSAGHYDVKVICTATIGCDGSVNLVQHQTGGHTRVAGVADVTLRHDQSVIIRFATGAKPPVTTAVAARAPQARGERP